MSFFLLLVAQRASKYAVVDRALYNYRQRSSMDSLCRKDDFIHNLITGRKLCVEHAKNISETVEILCVSAYVNTLIVQLKERSDKSVDLKPYEDTFRKA